MMNCLENSERIGVPCYGIFWVIGETESELTEQNLFCVTEPYVNAEYSDDKPIFNHKQYWQTLDKKVTHGKPFDCYPRGRVEIHNDKATIWLNNNIVHLADKIIELYSLSALPEIRVRVDGSKHYNSRFD